MKLAKETTCSVKMVYSNRTADDVLLKSELEAINKECSNIDVTHFFTRATEGVLPEGAKAGRVTLKMLQELGFPEPSPETLIACCGRPDFSNGILDMFRQIGYTDDMLHKF